ncbi:MAG: hypothetical protein ACP5QH_06000 [Thermoplasmata archaeon]|jgi:hypothetical protein
MAVLICPEGREVQVQKVAGVEYYTHLDDGTPCNYLNSLGPDSIRSIIMAMEKEDEYLLSQKIIMKQVLFNDLSMYFDLPLSLRNYRGVLLYNCEVLSHTYRLPKMRELINMSLKKFNPSLNAKLVLLDIFIRDLAVEPIDSLIGIFPGNSRYVRLYGIDSTESSVYYSLDLNYSPDVMLKWFPLVYTYTPFMFYGNRLEFLYNYLKILLYRGRKDRQVAMAFRDPEFRKRVLEMKRRNFNLVYLYSLSEDRAFRKELENVIKGWR